MFFLLPPLAVVDIFISVDRMYLTVVLQILRRHFTKSVMNRVRGRGLPILIDVGCPNQSINQSSRPAINQSRNQSINQLLDSAL